MTLTPPAEIMGKMQCYGPRELHDRRVAWIIAQKEAGHPYTKIGPALGISPTAARIAATARGYPSKAFIKDDRITRSKMALMGLYTGNLGDRFYQLPVDQQNRLIDLAIKRKTSVANALIAHYLETAK